MELLKFCYIWIVLSFVVFQSVMVGTEQSAFELPVQLVGFPFIIIAVRLTNFVKKLSYALSPVASTMEVCKLFSLSVLLFCVNTVDVNAEESPFELPVQFVGFPFIVGSVKITNFLKKLSYSLSPATYRSRNRRALIFTSEASDPFDPQDVEKYIISEFGARACVFERVCAHYASRAQTQPRPQMDWSQVFSQYKQSPDQAKELYLLSVFLGDIVGSPQLCHQLGKRRGCNESLLEGPQT